MAKNNFVKVFSLEVHHTFFEDNRCTCLQFRPAETTRQLMRRFGFLLRYKMNGFEIYTDNPNTLPDLLEYIAKSMPAYFDFSVQTDRQNFSLFTDLPVNSNGPINYDSGDASVEDDGTVTLIPSFAGGSTTELAQITIRFSDILNHTLANISARFQISFRARVTQWQYYIVNKSDVHFNNPGVAGKYNISFEGPFNVNTPGGEPALLFTSGEALLPLSENANYQFDFVNNFNKEQQDAFISESNMLYKGLPVPDPWATMFINNNGSPVFSSPVYVYL